MIFLGGFTVFSISRTAVKRRSFLTFIGQNTLVYYLHNSYVIQIMIVVFSFLGIRIQNIFVDSFVKTAAACAGCGIEAMLINRFLPEIVGKKRRKNTAV